MVAVAAGCHVALAAAVAGAQAARVVLWEPPDFQATPVSADLYDRLDRAAATGDRKLLVRLLLNEVVGVNTGSRVARLVFPLLFPSAFGRMVPANALAIPNLAVFARARRAGARLPTAAATIAACNPASDHRGQTWTGEVRGVGGASSVTFTSRGQGAAAITTYWSSVSPKSVPTSRNPASSSRSRRSPSVTGRSEIWYSCGSIRSLSSKRNTMWAMCS